jgi:serine/threonine protein kinase
MLAPDTRLKDRYRILHKIGGGGFGNVYKAVDEVFGCSVAIKETREEVANLDKLRKAFEREAKLLHGLKHDSLPRVTDYFFQEQTQFLVMDFVEGEDLAALLRDRLSQHRGPFTCQEILPWVDKILAALEYLHSRPEPIIHRDIKPANIKLAHDGEIYLLDFGLAKGMTGQMSTLIDGQPTSVVFGFTPQYAPLEQLQGTANGPESDIYALGATLYHLLTGQLPAPASQRDEALQRGQSDPLQPAHEVNPTIPHALSRIISEALAVRSWERIGSAKEMRAALSQARGEVAARSGTVAPVAAQAAPPDEGDRFSTLPLPQSREPASPDGGRVPRDGPLTRLRRHRRPWLAAGLALISLAALAAVARLVFPHWFGAAVVVKPDAQVAQATPETPPPLKPATPSDLNLRRTLDGHKSVVWSVAFSPDGSLAASAGEDRTILLWDTRSWASTSRPLTAHAGAVYSVAFSPDGKTLVSGSSDKSIKLWDTQTGQLLNALPQEDIRLPVLRVAFSPDGEFLASCSGEPKNGCEEIRLWDVRNGWKSKILEEGESPVFAMAFSPDGNTLAASGYGRTLQLWNLLGDGQRTDLPLEQVRGAFVTSLVFSADGRYIACGSSDTTIKLWAYQEQTRGWETLKPLAAHTKLITSVAFSPDNRTLASASLDSTIRLWDVSARTSKTLQASTGQGQLRTPQRATAFSPDGQVLLTGGQDSMLRVWQ